MVIGRPKAIAGAPEGPRTAKEGLSCPARNDGAAGRGRKFRRRCCASGDRGAAGLRPDTPIERPFWSARPDRTDQGRRWRPSLTERDAGTRHRQSFLPAQVPGPARSRCPLQRRERRSRAQSWPAALGAPWSGHRISRPHPVWDPQRFASRISTHLEDEAGEGSSIALRSPAQTQPISDRTPAPRRLRSGGASGPGVVWPPMAWRVRRHSEPTVSRRPSVLRKWIR